MYTNESDAASASNPNLLELSVLQMSIQPEGHHSRDQTGPEFKAKP